MQRLTTDQHDRMRRLARRSPAFLGMRHQVHDDHVEVTEPEPLVFGFESLSARLAGTPADDWPDAVDDYFRRAIDLITTGVPELDDPAADILGQVYLRLVSGDVAGLPDYTFEVAPGLRWSLAYDRSDSIHMLNDAHVRAHGIDRLSDAGAENLCGEVPDRVAVLPGDVHLLRGSDYVGSLLLVMPWLTEVLADDPEPPYGVLVGAPARDTTIVHVIRDGVGGRYAIGEIARLTAEYHDEASHPLNPCVHWWRPGRLDTIAVQRGPELRTTVPDELQDLLHELS